MPKKNIYKRIKILEEDYRDTMEFDHSQLRRHFKLKKKVDSVYFIMEGAILGACIAYLYDTILCS